jgi:hypothetical protein
MNFSWHWKRSVFDAVFSYREVKASALTKQLYRGTYGFDRRLAAGG